MENVAENRELEPPMIMTLDLLVKSYLEPRYLITPRIEIGEESGEIRYHPELSDRICKVRLIGGLSEPLGAYVDFINPDGSVQESKQVPYYKLFSSGVIANDSVSFDILSKSSLPKLGDELTSYLKGRVFTTNEYLQEELLQRPYRFITLSEPSAQMFSTIRFYGAKEPKEISVLFHQLLSSIEMSEEEKAKRIKKKED